MSTYLTSDLHGDLKRFKKLLNTIRFDYTSDVMYILGDVLDRGTEGIALLDFVRPYCESETKPMRLLKGNHELFAQMYLEGTLSIRQWSAWGGAQTAEQLQKLSAGEREERYHFIKNLKHYEVLTNSDGKEIVLTHSGIHADYIVEAAEGIDVSASIEKAVEANEFEYLISNDLFYVPRTVTKRFKQFLIVGHTPVMYTREDGSYEIIIEDTYMCIDSGAGHRRQGGKMSVYRMDDGKIFYL